MSPGIIPHRNLSVIVCGGRGYNEPTIVYQAIKRLVTEQGLVCVIHGAATGADQLADDAARRLAIHREPMAADWDRHGRTAGPIRNQAMLDELLRRMNDKSLRHRIGVVAFPGGAGTANMRQKALAAGLQYALWLPHVTPRPSNAARGRWGLRDTDERVSWYGGGPPES